MTEEYKKLDLSKNEVSLLIDGGPRSSRRGG